MKNLFYWGFLSLTGLSIVAIIAFAIETDLRYLAMLPLTGFGILAALLAKTPDQIDF